MNVHTQFNPHHPHEPAVARVLDADGRCLVCALSIAQRASSQLQRVATKAEAALSLLTKQKALSSGAREKCGVLADELMAAVEACPAPDARLVAQDMRNAGMDGLADRLDALSDDEKQG